MTFMLKSIEFYPECYVDTELMKTLLWNKNKFIVHVKGISNVGKTLEEQHTIYGDSRLVVGMVDKDKKFSDIKLLKYFSEEIVRCEDAGSPFVVYRHQKRTTQYLLVLGPKACDGWIYGAAVSAGINPAAYGLPPTLKELLAQSKKIKLEKQPGIAGLLKEIRRHSPPAYLQLLTFITERIREVGIENG